VEVKKYSEKIVKACYGADRIIEGPIIEVEAEKLWQA